MQERLNEGDVVRHFKGLYYKIISTNVKHTESGERFVCYKSLYDDNYYVRPYDMFMSKVDTDKYPNVDQTFRFENITNIMTTKGLDFFLKQINDDSNKNKAEFRIECALVQSPNKNN